MWICSALVGTRMQFTALSVWKQVPMFLLLI